MMEEHSPKAAEGTGPGGAGTTDQVFEVRITGTIPNDVLEQLTPVDATTRELRTSLRGRFKDQAELHGFLAKLRAFGLDVVEVRRVATPDPDDPDTDGP